MPADPKQLGLYAAWLVASGKVKVVSSIRQYLSAVRSMHREEGWDCTTPKASYELDSYIRGIARQLRRPPKRMSPITPAILHHLLDYPVISERTSYEMRVTTEITRCLYVVLFFSMLRVSSLVPSSPGLVDPMRQLTWDKIQVYGDGIVLNLELTKTIQDAGRIHQVALAASPGHKFCPVAALNRVAALRGERRHGSLVFEVPVGHHWEPLTRYKVDCLLTCQIEAAGLQPSNYKFHSFRRGGIQLAVTLEPRLHLIRLQTDHSSQAFEVYTSLPPWSRFNLVEQMLQDTSAPPL